MPKITRVSGWKTDQANQKWLPEITVSSCAPPSGPSTARPKRSQLLPVPTSTISCQVRICNEMAGSPAHIVLSLARRGRLDGRP